MIENIKNLRRLILGKMRHISLLLQNKNIEIDNGFYCASGCRISSGRKIQIGKNFYMGFNCHLGANAIIGNDVIFASNVALVGGDHKIDYIDCPIRFSGRDEYKTTVIENNVWVGHGAIILHGVHIANGAVVGAGSVVTKNVPPNAIVAGNPARFIRYRHHSSEN